MTRQILSEADVKQLLGDPSAETRVATLAKVAAGYDPKHLSAAERKIAEDIFRLMIKDAEVRVRAALALNIKDNPDVPHDIARTLAGDVEEVSLPVLQFSEVLLESDLIEIVRESTVQKQVAIAQRATVSEAVSEALVETKNEEVVTNLVANEGAEISEQSFQKVVDTFSENEGVQGALIGRHSLPVTVAERLVTKVSEKLKIVLVSKHELPDNLATDLVLQSRERATIGLSTESGVGDVEVLVRQLNANGRLTPSIVLRAVCMGDVTFFEVALAELAGVDLNGARHLIHDPGPYGLEGICKQAGLPSAYFPAARAAVEVARETEYDGGEHDRERYSRRMIERILTQYGDLGVDFEADDLEYLLRKMNTLHGDVDVLGS